MAEPAASDGRRGAGSATALENEYEALGRQATIDEWQRTLRTIAAAARAGGEIDLELVARRTIRRPLGVVAGLMEVCTAVASHQSVFVLNAVGNLRTDDPVTVERAAGAAEEIALSLRAPEQPLAEMYTLLALPLAEQSNAWESAPLESRERVTTALRSERDRLSDLTKEASSSSGGYLHYLRHRIADLVLVAGIEDDVGEWAFRLLQNRTENPDELGGILRQVPEASRQRFVRWVAAPRPGAPTDRIRYVLDLVGSSFPDDLDSETLRSLAEHEDAEIAAKAISLALVAEPDNPATVSRAAELIGRLPSDQATEVAHALVTHAARHIRAFAIPEARIELVVDAADDQGQDLAHAVAIQLTRAQNVGMALPWVRALERLPTEPADFREAASQVVALAARDPRPEAVSGSLAPFLTGERFRSAFWTVLDEVPPPVLDHLFRPLFAAGDAEENARAATDALTMFDGDLRSKTRAAATDALTEGRIDPDVLATAWPSDDAAAIANDLRARVVHAEAKRAGLEANLADIETATRRDLASAAVPALMWAIEASSTNAGIQDAYRRVAEALEPQRAAGGQPASEGAAESSVAPLAPGESDAKRLQALLGLGEADVGLLGTPDRLSGLGDDGFAQRVLTDLFERGRLFRMAVGLSAAARKVLLDAALRAGFVLPQSWGEHPALGGWLRQELARTSPMHGGDEVDLTSVFRIAADAFARLGAVEREARQRGDEVSRAVAATVVPILDELSSAVDGYYRVWEGLAKTGWRHVEVIGQHFSPDEIDSGRHEIADGHGSSAFVVRRPGIEVDGVVVAPAVLQGVDD